MVKNAQIVVKTQNNLMNMSELVLLVELTKIKRKMNSLHYNKRK